MRNSTTASMGKSGLGGGEVKSTTELPPLPPLASFFCYRGARSLEADTKYDTAAMPSPSLATGGGDEEDDGASDSDEGRGGRKVRLQCGGA
jgi:hypothetical protein